MSNSSLPQYKTRPIFFMCINAALGAFFFGYVISVFNPIQQFIQQNVFPRTSKHILYLMTSFTPLGGAFGAISATTLASRFGRRKIMLITDVCSIIGVILTLLNEQYLLLLGRLITGLCVGLNSSLVPLYISEMSPVKVKGFTGTFNQLFICTGILVSYLLGLNIPTGHHNPTSQWWRFMLGVPIIAPILRLARLLLTYNFETPRYLMVTNQDEEAKKALGRIYSSSYINEAFEVLEKELEYEKTKDHVTYKELFSKHYRRRFFVGCLLSVFQQACGINAIIMYSTKIFQKEDHSHNSHDAQLNTVVIGILNLIAAIIPIFFINKVGRRTLLIVGDVILCISLGSMSILGLIEGGSSSASKYFIFLFILGFGISLGSITWFYLAEILPDTGLGVSLLLHWISCFAVAQVFPYLIEALGFSQTFLVFTGMCLLGLVFIIGCIKETRGKSPIEIAEAFNKTSTRTDLENERLLDV